MALKKILEDFEKALKRLKEAYELANLMKEGKHYEFFRDSAIQRFEFTTERIWKTLKEFLCEKEGIVCKSPKSCIREFFSVGYLKEEETFSLLKAIDDQNRTSHIYHEEVAEDFFSFIGDYLTLFEKVLKTLKGAQR